MLPNLVFLASLLFLGLLVALVIPVDPRDHSCRPARPDLCKRRQLLIHLYDVTVEFLLCKDDRIEDDPDNSSCHASKKADT